MRVPWWRRLGLLLLLLLIGGCGQRVQVPVELNYRMVAEKDVPAALAAKATESKGVPGLWVLERPDETFLLIQAGEVQVSSAAIRLMEVRQAEDGKTIRILARVEPSQNGSSAPIAVVAVAVPPGKKWSLRLSHMDEELLTLQGMSIPDR